MYILIMCALCSYHPWFFLVLLLPVATEHAHRIHVWQVALLFCYGWLILSCMTEVLLTYMVKDGHMNFTIYS